MSLDLLQQIAQSNNWGAIYPELILGSLALGLLVLEVILPKFAHGLIPRIAIMGQLLLLAYIILYDRMGCCQGEAFGGMLLLSDTGQAFRIFFLTASLFVSYLAMVSLEKNELPRVEYFHILLVVTGALMLLAQSNHFVMLFVALETATVGFFILVSYFRTNALSLEAGLKYLITGALSSSILLFGIVLLYGAAGNPSIAGSHSDSLNFSNLNGFLAANSEDRASLIGMLMVISGIAFKIGAFPFQIWIPDVYQGAPTPTTALLAVASKAAGFAMLINLAKVFSPLSDILYPLLSVLAGLTILFGNFGALTQRNVKRIVGMSGVSHAGFLLIGIISASQVDWAYSAVIFYLFAYLFASMAVFAVLVHMPQKNDSELVLDDFGDLAERNGFLGLALAVGLGSLAGIPPLAGFIGKLLIFIAAFKAELYGLLTVGIIGVVVSIYYYFGWIKHAFFEVWKLQGDDRSEDSLLPGRNLRFFGRLAIGLAIVCTLLLGIYQGIWGNWLVGL